MNHIDFMHIALNLAKDAVKKGNEPFGALLVKYNQIVYTNENQIHTKYDMTYHAEHGLIRRFMQETHITDLSDYVLYTSCEPCFMCSGAMVWAQLGTLVYGASSKDLNEILNEKPYSSSKIVFHHSYHKPKVIKNILHDECVALLKDYFSK